MKIVIAPDKFKGTLPSSKVIAALSMGILSKVPNLEIKEITMADGGEGSAEIIAKHIHAKKKNINTLDAMERPISAEYHINEENIAVFDLASASGLYRVKDEIRNLNKLNTRGTGIIIKKLIPICRELIICLGGSATNDFALGAAFETGYYFSDQHKNRLSPYPENLSKIKEIHNEEISPFLKGVTFRCLCDVENILLGPQGAVNTFSKQKGATPEQLISLEEGMEQFCDLLETHSNREIKNIPRSGSAGGFGGGARGFFNAELESGFEYIAMITNLEEQIKTADLIITGEGKTDATSFQGKVVGGIIKLATKYNKKTVVVCGQTNLSPSNEYEVYSLSKTYGIDKSLTEPEDCLVDTGKRIGERLK